TRSVIGGEQSRWTFIREMMTLSAKYAAGDPRLAIRAGLYDGFDDVHQCSLDQSSPQEHRACGRGRADRVFAVTESVCRSIGLPAGEDEVSSAFPNDLAEPKEGTMADEPQQSNPLGLA